MQIQRVGGFVCDNSQTEASRTTLPALQENEWALNTHFSPIPILSELQRMDDLRWEDAEGEECKEAHEVAAAVFGFAAAANCWNGFGAIFGGMAAVEQLRAVGMSPDNSPTQSPHGQRRDYSPDRHERRPHDVKCYQDSNPGNDEAWEKGYRDVYHKEMANQKK
eukprot:c9796_g1_i3.p2 GENE.c9796_g1_i3~~c9796_g1_i3.p2  ORF type:complete len:164 (-),score=18.10 c9796_g1_i3:447-938(-)